MSNPFSSGQDPIDVHHVIPKRIRVPWLTITEVMPLAPDRPFRPLSRKLAFGCTAIAAAFSLLWVIREVYLGTLHMQFVATLAAACMVVAIATFVAIPREEQSQSRVWEPVLYPLLLAMFISIPPIIAWASEHQFGSKPAALPAIALFVSIVAPFAVSNQAAFGLGSVIPKLLVMFALVRNEDAHSWGYLFHGVLLSPQTALQAIIWFSAIASVAFVFVRKRYKTAWMATAGALLGIPLILLVGNILNLIGLS